MSQYNEPPVLLTSYSGLICAVILDIGLQKAIQFGNHFDPLGYI